MAPYGYDQIDDDHSECDKGCPLHDSHWQDDFAYTDDNRLPISADAPTLKDVAKLLKRAATEHENTVIYRFAFAYVDGETGLIQVITNPGMTQLRAINLLSRAIGTMAYQEAQAELEAEQMVGQGMQEAIKKAVEEGGVIPFDLTNILGGKPAIEAVSEDEAMRNMREGYL